MQLGYFKKLVISNIILKTSIGELNTPGRRRCKSRELYHIEGTRISVSSEKICHYLLSRVLVLKDPLNIVVPYEECSPPELT